MKICCLEKFGVPYTAEEIIGYPCCLSWWSPSSSAIPKQVSKSSSIWSLPSPGFIKWNVDASVTGNQDSSAIGGVLRNDMGIFMCVFSSLIPPMEINSAEIFAIFRAIKISLAFDHLKHSPMIIESDSANVVRWCRENDGRPWNLNFQLNFIRNARKDWMDLVILHKGRSSNMVADALTKQGLTRSDEFLAWL